ncbi:MAG: hypothetical protein U0994_10780, partial [Gemmatimonadales bacterium]|nr:hypothetical protein [Gemmatimonadales bacterium]
MTPPFGERYLRHPTDVHFQTSEPSTFVLLEELPDLKVRQLCRRRLIKHTSPDKKSKLALRCR